MMKITNKIFTALLFALITMPVWSDGCVLDVPSNKSISTEKIFFTKPNKTENTKALVCGDNYCKDKEFIYIYRDSFYFGITNSASLNTRLYTCDTGVISNNWKGAVEKSVPACADNKAPSGTSQISGTKLYGIKKDGYYTNICRVTKDENSTAATPAAAAAPAQPAATTTPTQPTTSKTGCVFDFPSDKSPSDEDIFFTKPVYENQKAKTEALICDDTHCKDKEFVYIANGSYYIGNTSVGKRLAQCNTYGNDHWSKEDETAVPACANNKAPNGTTAITGTNLYGVLKQGYYVNLCRVTKEENSAETEKPAKPAAAATKKQSTCADETEIAIDGVCKKRFGHTDADGNCENDDKTKCLSTERNTFSVYKDNKVETFKTRCTPEMPDGKVYCECQLPGKTPEEFVFETTLGYANCSRDCPTSCTTLGVQYAKGETICGQFEKLSNGTCIEKTHSDYPAVYACEMLDNGEWDKENTTCKCPNDLMWANNECVTATAAQDIKSDDEILQQFNNDVDTIISAFSGFVKKKFEECSAENGIIKNGVCEKPQETDK